MAGKGSNRYLVANASANDRPEQQQNNPDHHKLVSSRSSIQDKIAAFQKSSQGLSVRDRHHVRNRRALQEQNDALDKKAASFVEKDGRGRAKAADGGTAAKRGLSADPAVRTRKKKVAAVKTKLKVVDVPFADPKPVAADASNEASQDQIDVMTVFIAPPKPKRNPTEHFRTVVQTKVHALNAFKRGIMGKQNIEDDDDEDEGEEEESGNNTTSSSAGSILKKSQDALPRLKRVSFVNLPNRDQLSEPDLLSERARGGGGDGSSSFDSTRSISDESVLMAATYVASKDELLKPDPPAPPPVMVSSARRDACVSTSSDLLTWHLPGVVTPEMEAEELIRLRTRLVGEIASALMQLDLVNQELDKLLLSRHRTAEPRPPSPPRYPDLTPEQIRLLRFKSFSYPFLSEDAWYRTDDHLGDSGGSEFFVNGGGLEWEGSVDDNCSVNEDDSGFGGVGSGLAWADFLKMQETNIDDGESEML